jgi:hypothetical protein
MSISIGQFAELLRTHKNFYISDWTSRVYNREFIYE